MCVFLGIFVRCMRPKVTGRSLRFEDVVRLFILCFYVFTQELSKKRFNLTLDLDDDTEHAMSYAILSRIAFSQGEFEESLRLCDEGLPLTGKHFFFFSSSSSSSSFFLR
jgi:hypothetical protein